MQQISVEKAQTILPNLIDSALNGEEVIIREDNERAVQLVPVTKTKSSPKFGSAKGLIDFAQNFDEPPEDFAEYEK